jgi:hypothetical protein
VLRALHPCGLGIEGGAGGVCGVMGGHGGERKQTRLVYVEKMRRSIGNGGGGGAKRRGAKGRGEEGVR